MAKHPKKPKASKQKRVVIPQQRRLPDLNGCPVFRFDLIDRDGKFAFDTSRNDFEHKLVLEKIMTYSCMKWTEIMQHTHDTSNKSKHHFLKDLPRLSAEARDRLRKLRLDDFADILFSFSLENKIRLIGLREGDDFHVLWYDFHHEVYPSKK